MSSALQSKGVPLTKEEVMQLVNLVETHPAVFSKATNATNNILKETTWATITEEFNAVIASSPRKVEQLRLKWENLKKAARKRSTRIRMNNLKNGGGKPEFIPPDDALDRVANILGATCDGYTVQVGDDAVVEAVEEIDTPEEMETVEESAKPNFTFVSTPHAPALSPPRRKSKFYFSSVGSKGKLKRKTLSDEVKASIIERNKALTEYYKSKQKQEEELTALKKRKLEFEIYGYLKISRSTH